MNCLPMSELFSWWSEWYKPDHLNEKESSWFNVAHEIKETLTAGIKAVIRKTQQALRRVFEWIESILDKAFK